MSTPPTKPPLPSRRFSDTTWTTMFTKLSLFNSPSLPSLSHDAPPFSVDFSDESLKMEDNVTKKDIEALVKKVKRVRGDYEVYCQKLNVRYQQMMEKLKSEYESDLERTRKKLTETQQELEIARGQVARLEKCVEEVTDTSKHLTMLNQQLTEENEAFSKHAESLQKEKQELHDQLLAATKRRIDIQAQFLALQEDYAAMEARVNQRVPSDEMQDVTLEL